MNLKEKIEDFEDRIGENWRRRLKILVLTAAVFTALSCSKQDTNKYASRQDYQNSAQRADLYSQINEKEGR